MQSLGVIKNEYVFSIISRFISIGLSLIQSILIAKYLGSSLQGDMAYVTSISSIGAIIITFGIHQAYPYIRKKYTKEEIYNNYLVIVFLYFMFWASISAIIALILHDKINYVGISILIPIQGYANVVGYVCLVENSNQRNKWWVYTIFFEIIYILTIRKFVVCNWTVAFSIFFVAEFIRSIIFTVLLKPIFIINKAQQIRLFKQLIKMGFFPMLALLMTTLNYKLDVIMLQQFPNISASDLGVYSIGMAIADRIVLIPDTLKGILVSRLSKGGKELEVAKVCRLSFWANILICIGILVFGQKLIIALYGLEYEKSYTIVFICSIGTIFIGYFKLIAQYNIVNNRQIRNVILLSCSIILNIILNIVLIPKYGLNGAAFASGFGYFVSGITFVAWFSSKSGIPLKMMFLPQNEDWEIIKGTKKK